MSFLPKIAGDRPAIGTLVSLESPAVAEILSLCGFDWLFLDMEHGTLSVSSMQQSIQAMREGCSSIVRVPDNNAVWIKRALDTGCDGVIVPQVNSAEEAQRAVSAAKYAPLGARSVGIARAQGYGMTFADYLASANDQIALIIQIEHINAVNNLDAILAVDGIDGVLIGPYDLSASMNMMGEVGSEPVQQAIRRIKTGCREKSVPFGIFVLNPEAAQKEIEDGCSFLAVGTDTIFLSGAAKRALDLVKKTGALIEEEEPTSPSARSSLRVLLPRREEEEF